LPRSRFGQRVDERRRIGKAFGVDRDDARAVVVREGADEVGMPSAASLPQLIIARPNPNSCARACATTPIPPL
jgi:hypothetical protein